MTLNMVGVIVLAWLLSIGVVMSIESDPYKLLGISRDVTDAEVRKAYRRAALKYHPDKCQGADCEPGNFEAVTSAYESVADAEARRIYDLNGYGVRSHGDGSGSGGRGGSGYRGHSERRSRGNSGATFDDLFGGGWRNWNPGDHITYVHVRNGKSVKLEIFPDGTTVESEESALAMPSSSSYTGYSKTTMRSSSGHQSVHIQLDGLGSLEPLLVGAGVPSLVAAGLVGLLTLLCSPAGLFVCCVYCACGKNRNRDEVPFPGEHDQGGAQKNKNERVKAE